jgi:hypothetical protein
MWMFEGKGDEVGSGRKSSSLPRSARFTLLGANLNENDWASRASRPAGQRISFGGRRSVLFAILATRVILSALIADFFTYAYALIYTWARWRPVPQCHPHTKLFEIVK